VASDVSLSANIAFVCSGSGATASSSTSRPVVGVSDSGHPGLSPGPYLQWSAVVHSEGFSPASWSPDDLAALQGFFLHFHTTAELLSAVLRHASSCSKSAAESAAAVAGDSASASVFLQSDVVRNVNWLRAAQNDVAALGRRVRKFLHIPDISPILPPPANPEEERDFLLVKGFAESGVSLVFDKGFIATSSSGVYPKMRKLVERVRPAILSLLADVVKKGQALVLPRDVARKLQGSNSIPVHWVPKVSNALGRLIADASGGDHPLNGLECKTAAAETFGQIILPRVKDVAIFLLDALSKYDDPVLSIDDISGAFSRLWLSSASASKSVLEVTLDGGFEAGIVLSSMYFGGSSCPHAWQAVSRVLRALLARAGLPSLIYVDDIIRVGERKNVVTEGEKLKATMCDLLTPNTHIAWAEDKAVWGAKRAQFIGWDWCLTTSQVAMTARAVVRFALRLLAMRDREGTSVRAIQGVASLGARFSDILPTLAPLSFIFYDRISGAGQWRNLDAEVAITPLMRLAVNCWLTFLARAWNLGVDWARPLRRLVSLPVSWSFQFDGCLGGVGGVHPALIGPAYSSPIPPFAYSYPLAYEGLTSSQQNVTELLAVVLGIAGAVKLGARRCAFLLVGDSRTALAWVIKRIKSAQALRAFLLFHHIMEEAELQVGAELWLSSEANAIPDGLSRNKEVGSFPSLKDHLSGVLADAWVQEALAFCNPLLPLPESQQDLSALFESARCLARALL
jgi:hypothetical protein